MVKKTQKTALPSQDLLSDIQAISVIKKKKKRRKNSAKWKKNNKNTVSKNEKATTASTMWDSAKWNKTTTKKEGQKVWKTQSLSTKIPHPKSARKIQQKKNVENERKQLQQAIPKPTGDVIPEKAAKKLDNLVTLMPMNNFKVCWAPPDYATPEELDKKIEEYFAGWFSKRVVSQKLITHPDGTQEIEQQCMPMIGLVDLVLFLWFADKQSFYEYWKKPGFGYSIKRARMLIEREYEMALKWNNVAWAIFALKTNFGRKEPKEDDEKNQPNDLSTLLLDLRNARQQPNTIPSTSWPSMEVTESVPDSWWKLSPNETQIEQIPKEIIQWSAQPQSGTES